MSVRLAAAALAALLGLTACQPSVVRNTNRGELLVSVDADARPPALDFSYDVGTVAVGQRKEVVVRATNAGEDALTVVGVTLGAVGNGSWFVRDVTNRPLAPGASLTTTVTFAPAGVGAQTTQVTFSHDADAAFPSLVLTGTGS